MRGRRDLDRWPILQGMADRQTLQARARSMRREPTFGEQVAWKLLRDRALAGLKFRRQVPIGNYIADFACFSPKLIVELDGGVHGEDERVAYDAERDAWFRAQGFRVVRLRNQDAVHAPQRAVAAILEASGRGPVDPSSGARAPPSPAGGEG